MTSAARSLLIEHRPLIVILALGLLLRVLLLVAASGIHSETGDEPYYHGLAKGLLERNEFGLHEGKLTSCRPPLYPLLVSAVWRVAGESAQAVRIVQMALGLLTVVIVYQIGDLVYSRRVAVLAAAGVCFYPSLLFLNLLLITETLFTLLLALGVYGYLTTLRTSSGGRALATGSVLALGALTRSMLLPFSMLLIPLTVLAARGGLAARARVAALLLLGFAVTLAPWAYRNTRLQGVFTPVDSASGFQLRLGNWDNVLLGRMWETGMWVEAAWEREALSEDPRAPEWTEGQYDRWLRGKALRYMVENPGLTASRGVLKFANLWGLDRIFLGAVQQGAYAAPAWVTVVAGGALTLGFPAAVLLACLGIFLAPPHEPRDRAVLLGVILFTCAVHSLAFGHSRYNVPVMPYMILFASSALAERAWSRLREGPARAIPPLAAMLAFVSIWVHDALADADRIRRLLQALGM